MNVYNYINGKFIKPFILTYRKENYFNLLPGISDLHEKSLEEIRLYQLNIFTKIISHAFNYVPFYKREWTDIGLHPSDIKTLEDISKIPVLTKKKIRDNAEEILSIKSKKSDLIISGTGGTTDSPIELKYSKDRLMFKSAEMHYFREWWSWYLGDKVTYLWGAPQDIPNINTLKLKLLNKFIGRKQFLFASLLDDQILSGYVNEINRFKPGILQGYSNPVYILSDFVLRNNIQIYSPKSVVLTAEPVLPEQKKIIEKAFNCDVFSFYGCREGGYVGIECDNHSGYHINCSSLYLEIINSNKEPAKPGEIGSVVFTDLLNYDMPFIRYQIGDMATIDDRTCPCGSTLPKMSFFAGRETDVFTTPDGKLIPGVSLCDRVIEDSKGIQQLQFIQNKIDELDVKIVKGKEFKEQDIIKLDAKLDDYFKGSLRINKIFVDDIPKEKSGKTRFCISNIEKKF